MFKEKKDDIKSQLDLKEYCNMKDLHLTADGKVPILIFRLQADAKIAFLKWLEKYAKFSDGYALSISKCVDSIFDTYYFEPHIKTNARPEDRHYDGGNHEDQCSDIPNISLTQGRAAVVKKVLWLQDKDHYISHTYVLLNCRS